MIADLSDMIKLVILGFLLGAGITAIFKNYLVSNQPIKLSYTLRCEDGKCDTTYKANTR